MKLSASQVRFLDQYEGVYLTIRPERDGTIMPYRSESRTVEKLVGLGLVRWVETGKEGYAYNGVVITDAGRAALAAAKAGESFNPIKAIQQKPTPTNSENTDWEAIVNAIAASHIRAQRNAKENAYSVAAVLCEKGVDSAESLLVEIQNAEKFTVSESVMFRDLVHKAATEIACHSNDPAETAALTDKDRMQFRGYSFHRLDAGTGAEEWMWRCGEPQQCEYSEAPLTSLDEAVEDAMRHWRQRHIGQSKGPKPKATP